MGMQNIAAKGCLAPTLVLVYSNLLQGLECTYAYSGDSSDYYCHLPCKREGEYCDGDNHCCEVRCRRRFLPCVGSHT